MKTIFSCACRCPCLNNRVDNTDGLCMPCWREWCQGSGEHGPEADASYLGVYGITGVWTGWLISRAAHLVAETPAALQRADNPPLCACGFRMVSRPGAWKCYRHADPVVVLKTERFPRSPQVAVLPREAARC